MGIHYQDLFKHLNNNNLQRKMSLIDESGFIFRWASPLYELLCVCPILFLFLFPNQQFNFNEREKLFQITWNDEKIGQKWFLNFLKLQWMEWTPDDPTKYIVLSFVNTLSWVLSNIEHKKYQLEFQARGNSMLLIWVIAILYRVD